MFIDAIAPVLNAFYRSIVVYLPHLLGGIIILAVGLVLAQIIKKLLVSLSQFTKLDMIAAKSKIATKKEVQIWQEIIIELIGWTVVILFLVPAAEVWGLSQVTVVLNQLLLYLPNVFVAVVIGFVGILFANLIAGLIKHSLKTVGSTSAASLSVLAKYSILFFTALIVLNQLGIAQDLIRILFTGIVAMLSLAGGLAFGLGGKDIARDIMEEFRKNVKG